MSIHISITHSQAQHLVDQWNELANTSHQLTYAEANLIMCGDNFDDELIADGSVSVEVGSFESATGNPATFTVWADDVCMEEVAA
jgi:hypothetical protein|tara:strand:- start:269 stop:523 length:255 start_codon:yes stop_codon:yes gene_type:complete